MVSEIFYQVLIGINVGLITTVSYTISEAISKSKLDKVESKYRKEFFKHAVPKYNREVKRKVLLDLYQREIEELESLKHLFPMAKKSRNNIVKKLKSMTGHEETEAYIAGHMKTKLYFSL